jgi:hypothetical protein
MLEEPHQGWQRSRLARLQRPDDPVKFFSSGEQSSENRVQVCFLLSSQTAFF